MKRILGKRLRISFGLVAGFLLLSLTACGLPETPAASLATGGLPGGLGGATEQLAGYPFPVVQVSGIGRAAGTPDVATLFLEVTVTAETVAEARLTAAAAMDRVITSLVSNAIPESNIGTSHFSVRPEYDYGEDGREHVGYKVSNGLEVRVRAIDTVGTVIDDAIAAGGDYIVFNNLRFSISDTSELQKSARQAAVEDMQDRAAQLADYANLQLGALRMVSESPIGDVFQEARSFALLGAESADFGTPTLPGEKEIVVQVFGLYELLPSE